VADVLFGNTNPSGRLPVTFYKADEKLPAFDDYSMRNRTYRYFEGEALYPFGYGLSYTQFAYSGIKVDRAGDNITITVNVKNIGKRAGDEVAQLYVRSPSLRALKELRGIQRLTLKPGESRIATFKLLPGRDFTHYDAGQKKYVVSPGSYEVQVGASSADIRARARVTVE
jgi:beta-glucosidase